MFRSILLFGWRQFRQVEIDFHPRLTVLTGANGAGKTTVLNLVSRHFGWQSQFISTPKVRDSNARLSYSTDYWEFDEELESEAKAAKSPPEPVGPQRQMGSIVYENGVTSAMTVQTDMAASSYDVNMPNQQHVEELHIPSRGIAYPVSQSDIQLPASSKHSHRSTSTQ
jgi:predicted ATP-binding protein involved in virulence